MAYHDLYWPSADGLKLHARDHAGGIPGLPPIVCLPGLTRNARDFGALAARLTPAWRVIAVDLRGRGGSEYAKDPMTYVPPVYADDVAALVDELALPRVILFGTSLGGIVTMLLGEKLRGRVAGVMLNDIGPQVEATGNSRIRSHVGRSSVWPTWMHAARAVQEHHGAIYPGFGIEDWLAMAKRLYRLNSAGRIVLDYDLKIAEPLKLPPEKPAPDLWPLLDSLVEVPVLIVSGEESDVLSPLTAGRMVTALPQAELVMVPGVGHSPTLAEPEALAGIERLLARVEESVPA